MSNLLDYIGLGRFLDKLKTLFVTDLGTSGNNLTWTKNGTTNNITIPYATQAGALSILQSKTYTNVIGTANNNPGAVFYFLSVKPTDWNLPCIVTYRITARMGGLASNIAGTAISILKVAFTRNGLTAYGVWNYIGNTSYRPYYYHYRYLVTETGFNAGYGHLLGIGLNSSYNPTTAANARTFDVEVLEISNGTFTLFDTMTKYASVPGTGSTNYSGETTLNATTQGDTHSGDVNQTDRLMYNGGVGPMSANGLFPYSLIMQNNVGSWDCFPATNSGVGTNKTKKTIGFKIDSPIYYWSSSTAGAANTVNIGSLYLSIPMDLRYSTNCGTTLTNSREVYLVGTVDSDRLFYLDDVWYTQTLPSIDDGKVYILLGQAHNTYCIQLYPHHPIYCFRNGAIRIWTGKADQEPRDYSYDYFTTEALEDGTFNFLPFNNNEIYYSTDGKNWTKGNSVSVSVGDKVMWKGEMTPLEQDHSGGIGTFGSGENANPPVTTISYKAYGNTMSLLYGDNFIGKTELVGNWTFNCLFRKTKITESHNVIIPATTLTSHCYWKMFYQCKQLVSMPTLVATTLASICYGIMFAECSALTDNIPSELPVTTLADSCYINMFYNCTSLVVAPKLPATTLTSNCYNAMFFGCSNLEVAPELPAPTLTSNCYWHMFDGCSKLNYIKCLATNKSVGGCCAVWMQNVATSGIFIRANSTTWGVGGSGTSPGVPSGWNIYSESEWEVVRHYELVTLSANGLMSSSDKTKLDGIAAGAQVNVVTSVDTTATAGVNLSLTSGTLDVTVSSGSIASGNGNVVTGGTVYAVTSTLAPKASPALTGTPTAPTATAGTNTTLIATTAFVLNAVDSKTHYIANLLSGTAANYITEPEVKTVKINGSTTNSASTNNCVLLYDTTNKCLKFVFN